MKENSLIAFIATLIIAGIVSIIAMPEGRIVEYRPNSASENGNYIQVVVENGIDNRMECSGMSIQQVSALCDSLNKHIPKR